MIDDCSHIAPANINSSKQAQPRHQHGFTPIVMRHWGNLVQLSPTASAQQHSRPSQTHRRARGAVDHELASDGGGSSVTECSSPQQRKPNGNLRPASPQQVNGLHVASLQTPQMSPATMQPQDTIETNHDSSHLSEPGSVTGHPSLQQNDSDGMRTGFKEGGASVHHGSNGYSVPESPPDGQLDAADVEDMKLPKTPALGHATHAPQTRPTNDEAVISELQWRLAAAEAESVAARCGGPQAVGC